LTSAELKQLESAFQALLSPLDYETLDEWRSAVNRRLRILFHADVAISAFPPGVVPTAVHSEELSPSQLAAYRFDDEGLRRAVRMGLEVANTDQIVAGDKDWYDRDPEVNRFYRPNHIENFIGALVWRPEQDQAAGIQLHREHFDCEMFAAKGLAVMRLLLPAIKAGTASALDWHRFRQTLGLLLDHLAEGVLICDRDGRAIYRNTALIGLLAEDPERDRLESCLRRVGARLSVIGRRRRSTAPHGLGHQELGTGRGRYRLRGTLLGAQWGAREAIGVVLERLSPAVPSDDELREQFRLTRREIEVARLLARGLANVELAEILGVSQHTAERHTEHVLLKVGVGSRAAVGAALRGER
jgi:DNA-binding CsgD family transcriptional regulator